MERPPNESKTESTRDNSSLAIKNVVTVFLSYHGRILLLKRSDRVGSYRGRWAGISGYIEQNEASIDRALKEVSEEVGLSSSEISLIKTGQPFPALDVSIGTLFVVHPFLFSTSNPKVRLDWEHETCRWIRSQDLRRFETVPKLEESLDRVLEDTLTLRSVPPVVLASLTDLKEDRVHGASELSRKSLTAMTMLVQLSQATTSEGLLAELKVFGQELMNSRPSMAPLTNLVGRLLYAIEAKSENVSVSSIEELKQTVTSTCQQLADDSKRAVHEIAVRASQLMHDGMTFFTHSRSATVYETFKTAVTAGARIRAIVAESRPLCEGKDTAQELSALGIPVTLAVDGAVGHLMKSADACVVGADSVLCDGTVVNKIGTFPLALSAREHGEPFHVLCETSKFNLRSMFEPQVETEEMDPFEVLPYPHHALVSVRNPYFDKTPAKFVSKLITEEGELSSQELQKVFRRMLAVTYL